MPSSLKTFLRRCALFALGLPLLSFAGGKPAPQELPELALTDGRTLQNVTVRSYNPDTDRFLIMSGRTLTSLNASQLYPETAERLRAEVPVLGQTSSQTPTPVTRPAARILTIVPAPEQIEADLTLSVRNAHRQAVKEHAEDFYLRRFRAGSDGVFAWNVRIETEDPVPVTGWPNRFRVEGKATLDISSPWTRTTSTFEAITEHNASGAIKVLDFSRKT